MSISPKISQSVELMLVEEAVISPDVISLFNHPSNKVSWGGEQSRARLPFGTWGRGDKGDTILKYFILTYLSLVLIFIKHYRDSMCFYA